MNRIENQVKNEDVVRIFEQAVTVTILYGQVLEDMGSAADARPTLAAAEEQQRELGRKIDALPDGGWRFVKQAMRNIMIAAEEEKSFTL